MVAQRVNIGAKVLSDVLMNMYQMQLQSYDRQLKDALESVRTLRIAVSVCEEAAESGDAEKLKNAADICRQIIAVVPKLDPINRGEDLKQND